MKLNTLKRTIAISTLSLVALLGTSEVANAQGNRQIQRQKQKVEKQQQKVQNQRAKLEAQRIKLEQQRQEQLRQQNMRNRNGNVYSNNNRNNNNRYRVYRNGSYYQTDNRGAELLKQAVNAGYQQGYRAGQSDRSGRRSGSYNNNSVYRSGNYGYQSYVDRSQYQYYFQQGFEKGYQDGYNSRNQYGSNNNGSLNILGTILQGILNIQQF